MVGSLQLGHLATRGSWVSLSPSVAAGPAHRASTLLALLVGSLILSAIVGGAAAAAVYVFLARRGGDPREREWRRYVNGRFRAAGWYARGFVRWKTRLDRIFGLLLAEDLGEGPAVDLGCGHGATLALLAFRDPRPGALGCDLDARPHRGRLAGAGRAGRHLSTSDVRTFPLPAAGLILIIDVLQYLDPADQASLLRRCAGALAPGGRLIFRLPDTSAGPPDAGDATPRPAAPRDRRLERPPRLPAAGDVRAAAGRGRDERRRAQVSQPAAARPRRLLRAQDRRAGMTDRLLSSDRLAHAADDRSRCSLAVGAITVLLVANMRNLQLRTDITDLVGTSSPAARALREFIREFGYGNRFFVVVEAGGASEVDAERMEQAADRLVDGMSASGLFTSARSQLSEAEMLQLARFYVDSFPAFADPGQRARLAARLSPAGREGARPPGGGGAADVLLDDRARVLRRWTRSGCWSSSTRPPARPAASRASTSSGAAAAGSSAGITARCSSSPSRAQPASDYEFAVRLMSWTRSRIAASLAEPGPTGGRCG